MFSALLFRHFVEELLCGHLRPRILQLSCNLLTTSTRQSSSATQVPFVASRDQSQSLPRLECFSSIVPFVALKLILQQRPVDDARR
jgi:hypothetical protein